MITIKTKIGGSVVEVAADKMIHAIQGAAFFMELPTKCPRCGDENLRFTYRKTKEGYHYYGMACGRGHSTSFGQKQEDSTLFYKRNETWQTYEERTTAAPDPRDPSQHEDPANAARPEPDDDGVPF